MLYTINLRLCDCVGFMQIRSQLSMEKKTTTLKSEFVVVEVKLTFSIHLMKIWRDCRLYLKECTFDMR